MMGADLYRRTRRLQRTAGDVILTKIVCKSPTEITLAICGDEKYGALPFPGAVRDVIYETWSRGVVAIIDFWNGRNLTNRVLVAQAPAVRLALLRAARRPGRVSNPEIVVRAYTGDKPTLEYFGAIGGGMPRRHALATVPMRLKIVHVVHT
jgi:hypothetical protein